MRDSLPEYTGTGIALADQKGRFVLAGLTGGYSALMGQTFAQYCMRLTGPNDGVGVLVHRDALAETDRPQFPPCGALRFHDVTLDHQGRFLPPQEMRKMMGIGPGSEVIVTGVGPAIVLVDAEVSEITSSHRKEIEELIFQITLCPNAEQQNERHVCIELPDLPPDERGRAMCDAILTIISSLRVNECVTSVSFTIGGTSVSAPAKAKNNEA